MVIRGGINSLNQNTERDVPGVVDVMGVALATANVTVNNESVYRKREYFSHELAVDNTNHPVWQSVSVAASGETSVTGSVFVAESPEVIHDATHDGYDDDGNQLRDGRWDYEWDAENRLKTLRSLSGSPASERRIVFEYDGKGRRIHQTVWNDRDDGQGSEISDTLFLYPVIPQKMEERRLS